MARELKFEKLLNSKYSEDKKSGWIFIIKSFLNIQFVITRNFHLQSLSQEYIYIVLLSTWMHSLILSTVTQSCEEWLFFWLIGNENELKRHFSFSFSTFAYHNSIRNPLAGLEGLIFNFRGCCRWGTRVVHHQDRQEHCEQWAVTRVKLQRQLNIHAFTW